MLPPFRQVDHRISRRVEDIAGRNDVRATEEHNSIAVGVRRGQPDKLDSLTVERQIQLRRGECHRRPGAHWRRRRLAGGRAHAVEDRFVRDHDGSFLLALPRPNRLAERLHGHIAAHMIGVGAGVGEVANRFVRNALDRGDCLRAQWLGAGIDNEQPVRADVDGDVPSGATDHVGICGNLNDLDRRPRGGRGDRRRRRRGMLLRARASPAGSDRNSSRNLL